MQAGDSAPATAGDSAPATAAGLFAALNLRGVRLEPPAEAPAA